MINISKNFIGFIKRNIIFVFFFLIIIILEVNIYNQRFFVTTLHNLRKYEFSVSDGTLFGFTETNGRLFSEHDDPNITFRNIDDRVRYISIQCSNPNPEALSQVFYRRHNEDWTEQNSITFPLSNSETTVSLPRTIKVTSLRLDLTNTEGDTLFCEGFTLNPETMFNFSYLRFVLLILSILGIFFGNKINPQKVSNSLSNLLVKNGIWFFVILIILINLSYPVTLTFDSAHYLQHAYFIIDGSWESWDPIRYVGFPMHIYLSLIILGQNQNALLYPLILAHVLLYVFSCLILFEVFKLRNGLSRFFVAFLVFFFVAMDPTVFGYYHTLLTEFLSATIAVISCYVALKLFQSKLLTKQFYLLSSFYLLLVPVAWHLKQPYIGAAYFPLLIVSLLILIRERSWKSLAFVAGINVVVMAIILVSTVSWTNFLRAGQNPMKENRLLSTFVENQIYYQSTSSKANPMGYLKDKVDEFLAFSNYYIFDFHTYTVIRDPFIGRGNENSVIAHRMFTNPGVSNLHFYSPSLTQYAIKYRTNYEPPVWINDIFLSRIRLSNILFTVTNIVIPFAVLISGYLWIKKSNCVNLSLFILTSASLLNLVSHLYFLVPNDRYQFWGHVLNLLALLIIGITVFYWLKDKYIDESFSHDNLPTAEHSSHEK